MTDDKTKTLKVSEKTHHKIKVFAATTKRPVNEVATEALNEGVKVMKAKKGGAA